jgi:hypothetical protein
MRGPLRGSGTVICEALASGYMIDSSGDNTHSTLGRSFRTPAHPALLAALGRASYCFLSLEETVTAILYEAGAADLSTTRGKTAGDKEDALGQLAKEYRQSSNGAHVAAALEAEKSWKTVARTPEDLLDLATKIEIAIDPLNNAREAVRRLPLSALLT